IPETDSNSIRSTASEVVDATAYGHRVIFVLLPIYTGLTSVRVYRNSRQEYPQIGTVRGVGTDQSEETVPCSESTQHSDIPNAYEVRWRHGLSTLGLTLTSRSLHPP